MSTLSKEELEQKRRKLEEIKRQQDKDEEKKVARLQQHKSIMKDDALLTEARIEKKNWYMGMLGCEDVEPFLKKKGDFAVRAAERQNTNQLILSVCGEDNRKFHFVLICGVKSKRWSLLPPGPNTVDFETIPELVEYYKKHVIPLPKSYGNLHLDSPCKRPKWILRRQNVKYSEKDLLGQGNFCKVFKGKLDKELDVAIKVCHNTDKSKEHSAEDGKAFMAREALIKEGTLMQSMSHPNVIKFYGICCEKPPIMVVMELCSGGSLLTHLQTFGSKISVGERVKFAIETASGMEYLHNNGFVHRDLAARNCLISQHGVVKIADFGLSKFLDDIVLAEKETKQEIPLRWMAPESLQLKPVFSIESDVWSYGMMLFEIFGDGKRPWDNWEHKKIATYIRRVQMPDFPENTPHEIKSMVAQKIWVLDPAKRYEFSDILKVLEYVQICKPCPKITTVSKIPGVKVLSKEELDSKENEQEFDIAKSIMENATKVFTQNKESVMPQLEMANNELIINPITPISHVSPKKSPVKKKKSNRKTRRKGAADVTKEFTQENMPSSNLEDSKKKIKKSIVSPRRNAQVSVPIVNAPIKSREKRTSQPKESTN